jgi:hypothetical protein
MRRWGFVAAAILLAAGCSENGGGQPRRAESSPSSTKTSAVAPATPPAAGAPIGDLVAWIGAGEAIDANGFHTVTRDGEKTDVAPDVAFVIPSGKARCMTDHKYNHGALACLVDFTNPPPRPSPDLEGFVGRWVDFDGPSIQVGSQHGDPGRFVYGDGPQLPYGKSLKFGDYQCRADQVGLYCADLVTQTAAKFSDAGVEAFGCLQPVTPPVDIGLEWRCP